MATINFPFGAPDNQTIADAATANPTITNNFTVLKCSAGLSQALTLSLTAGTGLKDGAIVVFEIVQKATKQDISFGSAGSTVVAPSVTGVNSKTQAVMLRYEDSSTSFRAIAGWVQLN